MEESLRSAGQDLVRRREEEVSRRQSGRGDEGIEGFARQVQRVDAVRLATLSIPSVGCSSPSSRLRGEGRVRGSLQEGGVWRVPLTRIAPQSDLSPQAARGEAFQITS